MVKRLLVPAKQARVIGTARAGWFWPFPPPASYSWSEHARSLATHYMWPAIFAFYTPDRHQVTNVRESVRLFYHFENAVRHYQEEFLGMAKQNERIAVNRWLNLRLSDEDKAQIQDEPLAIENVVTEFMSLVYLGYRLSVSYDEYSKAMQASLVCVDKDNPDAGHGVSARHPDLDWCLRSLLYKVQLVGVGHWADSADSPGADAWS